MQTHFAPGAAPASDAPSPVLANLPAEQAPTMDQASGAGRLHLHRRQPPSHEDGGGRSDTSDEDGGRNDRTEAAGLRRRIQDLEAELRKVMAARVKLEAWHAQAKTVEILEQTAEMTFAPISADVLVREADHRIRNSLQTVVALLDKQAHNADAEAVRNALSVARARVAAIAQVHAVLQASTPRCGVIPEVDLKAYVEGLCAALEKAMDLDGEQRILQVSMTPLPVSPLIAQSIGLTVSELITNAFRHAFWPGQPGTVRVSSAHGSDGSYQISVGDDGRGLPRGFDLRRRPSPGLGLRLVTMLVDQARATLSVDVHAGTRFTLRLAAPPTATPVPVS